MSERCGPGRVRAHTLHVRVRRFGLRRYDVVGMVTFDRLRGPSRGASRVRAGEAERSASRVPERGAARDLPRDVAHGRRLAFAC